MLDKDYPYIELNAKKQQYINFTDRCTRCPICNKVFYIRKVDEWAYKAQNKRKSLRIFCSYNCKGKAMKEMFAEPKKDGRRLYLEYPKDFPDNWDTEYARYMDMAITRAEASRVMGIGVTKFDTLKKFYEALVEEGLVDEKA